jgi:lysophospholipid acyltransferase (LPLAT)-like uncharacterized protein
LVLFNPRGQVQASPSGVLIWLLPPAAEPVAKKRTLLNNPLLATLAGVVLNAYGELVVRTSRVRIQAHPGVDQLVHEQGIPVIYALWHCHVFFVPLLRRYGRRPLAVLLSSHRDAQIVGVAARLRGVQLVEGSSTRGGMKAYRQLLRCLEQRQAVCITPDGPKGPAQRVKSGVIQLARQSGCAVVPVSMACSRQHRLRSWDRSVLPLPFGHHVLRIGAPLYFNASDGLLSQQEDLAAALQTAAGQAQAALAPVPV